MDEHYTEVSLSEDFPGMNAAEDFDHSAEGALEPSEKPSFIETQNSNSVAQESESPDLLSGSDDERDINTDLDDDDRIPNTDLDDSDVVLAKMYGDVYEAEDLVTLDTSLSDDDDEREPNTDLDETDR